MVVAASGEGHRMTTLALEPLVDVPRSVVDHRRGSQAMLMFIVTEAMLFLMFFFAYYYLGHNKPAWPTELPKLTLALVMLAVLLSSSLVLHAGERAVKVGRFAQAKVWTAVTVLMGVAFLVLQVFEYRDHLKTLTPQTNAYGSLFYTITSFHAAHVILGLLMLAYVLLLPAAHLGKAEKPPHNCLHNAAMYWHFVDAVWVVIVALLYVAPHVTAP
jgi:heme/copper-type cytochrome/quinol oxidase subunit 3